ncbi:MAG: hypothetical protein ACE5MI_07535 [Acidimicrobiia bacterium]
MKVVLWCFSSVAVRAARVLAADPDVSEIGIVSDSGQTPHEYRAVSPSDLASWDVLATDGALPPDEKLIPRWVVTTREADGKPSQPNQIVGANIVSGIAGSLAALELARTDRKVRLAYTVSGAPLRRGEQLRFPSPVGTLYGRPPQGASLPSGLDRVWEAPTHDQWAGVLVWRAQDGSPQRVLGVADDRGFLAAIALAAATVAAGRGAYRSVPGYAFEAPAALVEVAVGSGLTVASYSSED